MSSRAAAAPVGDPAPDFKLQDQDENWVTLSGLTARGPVMIAFYPGDFTPVCTRQLCAYQEMYDQFVKYGISVVGISHNTPEEHQKFRARYHFAFPLLSDPGKATFKQWGVTSLFMFGGASRAVFVVGRNGKVAYRYVEPTSLSYRKPGELIGAIEQLKAKGVL
jgi:thioredoxin-dependent peroxiredoxin